MFRLLLQYLKLTIWLSIPAQMKSHILSNNTNTFYLAQPTLICFTIPTDVKMLYEIHPRCNANPNTTITYCRIISTTCFSLKKASSG